MKLALSGADIIFGCKLAEMKEKLSGIFSHFVLDAVHVHGNKPPAQPQPDFYQSVKEGAATGETWKSKQ